MKQYKILGLCIFMFLGSLCLLSGVFATTTMPTTCYDMDETSGTTLIDTFGFYNGNVSNAGIWSNSGCKLGSGCLYSGSTPYTAQINNQENLNLQSGENLIICTWFKWTSDAGGIIWSSYPYDSTNTFIQLLTDSSGNIQSQAKYSSTQYYTSNAAISTNTWNFGCNGRKNGRELLWLNGVLIDNISITTNQLYNSGRILMFDHGAGYTYLEAYLDGFLIFGNDVAGSVSTTDIQYYYNGGSGMTCNNILGGDVINLESIKANNETFLNNSWFSTTDILFNLNLSVTAGTSNPNTTIYVYKNNSLYYTETINEDLTPSFNITTFTDSGSRYNISWYSINNVTNSTFGNYSIIVDITPPTINNSLPLEWFSYNINLSNYISCYDIESGTCNITFLLDGVSVPTNITSYNFTYNGNQTYDIIAEDAAGNTVTENGTVFVNPYQCWNFVYPDGENLTEILIDNATQPNPYCVKLYDIGLGNYIFNASGLGLVAQALNYSFNTTSDINDSITMYNNYLQLNIYDTDTNNLISQLVNINLIGPEFAAPFSTANGTITITNISELPAEYHLVLDSSGYETLDYYFTHTGYTIVNLSLYMQNATGTTPITYYIEDIFSNRMGSSPTYPKCLVKISEYDISSNSYIPQTMEYTNSNGEVVFNLNVAKYIKPTVVCPSGTYEGTYNFDGEKITSTPITLTIGTTEFAVFEDLPSFSYEPINYTQVNNVTGRFTLTYSDSNNVISQVCLNITNKTFTEETEISSTCLSTATGSINIDISTSEGETYVAYAYFVYNDETYDLPPYVKTIPIGYEDLGLIGLFAALALTILFSLAGLAFPGEAKVWAVLFGGTLGLWISSVIALIPMNYYALSGWSALLVLGVIFS